jgi:hypothetical protein
MCNMHVGPVCTAYNSLLLGHYTDRAISASVTYTYIEATVVHLFH